MMSSSNVFRRLVFIAAISTVLVFLGANMICTSALTNLRAADTHHRHAQGNVDGTSIKLQIKETTQTENVKYAKRAIALLRGENRSYHRSPITPEIQQAIELLKKVGRDSSSSFPNDATDSTQGDIITPPIALASPEKWYSAKNSTAKRIARKVAKRAASMRGDESVNDKSVQEDRIQTRANEECEHNRTAVRNTMRRAWSAYKRYAWGFDELQPLTLNGNEHWGGFAATMLDALDTLWLMGMKSEFNEAASHIGENVTFDKDHICSVFEMTIRALGGLCAAYTLSGNDVFLRKATELGNRLLPAFDTPSGLPSSSVNLRTGQRSYASWLHGQVVLSEAGSVQMEMRALSRITQDPKYATKGDAAMTRILSNPNRNGLYYDTMHRDSGSPAGSNVGVGALSDSFYEYLLKLWLQSGKKDQFYRDKWDDAVDGFHKHLLRTSNGMLFISGSNTGGRMEHLSCFLPGMLALGSVTSKGTLGEKNADRDMQTAKSLLETCIAMYTSTSTGLAADVVDYSLRPVDVVYKLRPETAESLFWLYTITKDQRYRDIAWTIFESIEKHCSAEKHGGVGYGAYPNAQRTGMKPINKMESFFLGETLKYLYIIFDKEITKLEWHEHKLFTTEAHVVEVA